MRPNKKLQDAISKVADQMPFGHVQAECDPAGFLEDVADKLKQMKWRKVEDEEPPYPGVEIIVKDRAGHVWITQCFEGYHWDILNFWTEGYTFVYWMPIPGGE